MPHTPSPSSLDGVAMDLTAVRNLVRERLAEAAGEMEARGLPVPALDGKALRPLTAYLTVPPDKRDDLDRRFWMGALAVEMVHEASLLHDDILDDAPERRGRPTLSAAAGVGPALVQGDHLLTAAYRVAVETGSPPFLTEFIRAVERTVAGEIAQEKAQGRPLQETEYRAIVTGKSGELFRAVFSLAPHLMDLGDPESVGRVGARLGCFYQMVDDFLDYCPDAERGKVPLQDFRQGKWTWPLGLLPFPALRATEAEVLGALFTPPSPGVEAPMEKGVRALEKEVSSLLADLSAAGMRSDCLAELLHGWLELVRKSALMEVVRFADSSEDSVTTPHATETPAPENLAVVRLTNEAAALSTETARLAYFGYHGRTFRFASRLFPADALASVAGVYAFCRFTDDLVDEGGDELPSVLSQRLDLWGELAQQAYRDSSTGVPLLDQVMGEMRAQGVPFHYAEALLEGVRMDLNPAGYASMEELRAYSYRVASVVGGWLTELFGVHDPGVLDRAFAMGHAMQLTNILRDVGEDLSAGRIYLPVDMMKRHGVDEPLLRAMAQHRAPIFPGYRYLLEELMSEADAEYERGFGGIPALPLFFRGPVAMAARAYQGIHGEIRRNGYDNLNQRARTSLIRKLRFGLKGLTQLLWMTVETRFRATSPPVPDVPDRNRFPGSHTSEEGQEAPA